MAISTFPKGGFMRPACATALFFTAVLQISLFIPAATAQSVPSKSKNGGQRPAPSVEPGAGQAPMEIWFFDRMQGDDEIAYVNALMQVVDARWRACNGSSRKSSPAN
jgi:hypothetical protein